VGPSPTIPTSFVPKQPVHSAARFEKSGGNMLLLIASFMFIFALVGSAGVFGYGTYLDSVLKTKAAALAATEASVNTEAVEEFIRFRDRFAAADEVLDNHVSASAFFDLLESITLANVRFASLNFELQENGVFRIDMDGTARTFNALAAQSKAFADEKLIKRAIFANIATEQNSTTVSFSVTAELDPRLVEFVVGGVSQAPAAPATSTPLATTTPATPTTAPATVPSSSTSSSPISL
jgi:hypothetical protein